MRLTLRAADPLDKFDRLLKDEAFWKRYRADLEKTLTPKFSAILLAGIESGMKVGASKGYVQVGSYREKPDSLTFPKLKLPKVLSVDALHKVGDAAIKKYIPQFLDAITQTTYDGIKAAVVRAREDGSGVFGVLDSARTYFSPERAQRIAVTETTRLYGVGAQEAYRAQGVTTWTWQTVEDGFVDEDCDDLSGTEFDIAEEFEPAHPNCRCFPVPGEVG